MWLKQIKRRLANWLSGGELDLLSSRLLVCASAAHGNDTFRGQPIWSDQAEEVFALHTVAVRNTYEKMKAEAKFAEVVKLWNHINANLNTNPEKN